MAAVSPEIRGSHEGHQPALKPPPTVQNSGIWCWKQENTHVP